MLQVCNRSRHHKSTIYTLSFFDASAFDKVWDNIWTHTQIHTTHRMDVDDMYLKTTIRFVTQRINVWDCNRTNWGIKTPGRKLAPSRARRRVAGGGLLHLAVRPSTHSLSIYALLRIPFKIIRSISFMDSKIKKLYLFHTNSDRRQILYDKYMF